MLLCSAAFHCTAPFSRMQRIRAQHAQSEAAIKGLLSLQAVRQVTSLEPQESTPFVGEALTRLREEVGVRLAHLKLKHACRVIQA